MKLDWWFRDTGTREPPRAEERSSEDVRLEFSIRMPVSEARQIACHGAYAARGVARIVSEACVAAVALRRRPTRFLAAQRDRLRRAATRRKATRVPNSLEQDWPWKPEEP